MLNVGFMRRLSASAVLGLHALATLAGPVAAQPFMVRDLTQRPGEPYSGPASLETRFVRQFGKRVLFEHADTAHGREPWVLDLDGRQQYRLIDLCPGACSSAIQVLTSHDSSVLFEHVPDRQASKVELWGSDGTSEGTKRLSVGEEYLHLGSLGELSLLAQKERLSWQLLVSDGTTHGTSYVRSLPNRPGPSVAVGETLLFFVRDADGNSLWRSDGSADGTNRIASTLDYPTLSLHYPELAKVGDTAVFTAPREDLAGTYLWFSDGTASGTVASSIPGGGKITPAGSLGYFVRDGLWRTDGTVEGTLLLQAGSQWNRFSLSGGLSFQNLFVVQLHNGFPSQLWISDGTEGGTFQLEKSEDGLSVSNSVPVVALGNGVLLDGRNGLWFSDGTSEGTVLLTGEPPNFLGWRFRYLGLLGGQAVFSEGGSTDLWVSDGTRAGTKILGSVNPLWNGGGAGLGRWAASESMLYISMRRYVGEPWKLLSTDGVAFYESDLLEVEPTEGGLGARPRELATTANEVVFLVDDVVPEPGPYRSDGTEEGTHLVELPTYDSTRSLVEAGGSILVSTSTETWLLRDPDLEPVEVSGTARVPGGYWVRLGERLLVSDGEGLKVASANIGEFSHVSDLSCSSNFVPWGSRAVCAHRVSSDSGGLSVTDGTSAGTSELFRTEPGSGPISNSGLAVVGDELWYLNRFAELTSVSASGRFSDAVSLLDGPLSREPSGGLVQLTPLGSQALFVWNTGEHGEELFVTDGSVEGTRVLEIWPGHMGSFPRELTRNGERVFFRADHPDTGRELYVTDGRTVHLVADLWPGSNPSNPHGLLSWESGVFFSASDGVLGHELWYSDGSTTTRLSDINPGASSSNPEELVAANSTIFFRAHDGQHGAELWAIDAEAASVSLFFGGFESGDTRAWSGESP